MIKARIRDGAKWAAISVGLFYATWITMSLLMMLISVSISGEGGFHLIRNRDTVPFQHVFTILAIFLPLIIPWLAIRKMKLKLSSTVSHPENAVGGMAWGGAAVLWLTIAVMSAGEFTQPHGWEIFKLACAAFSIPTAAMFGGALLATWLLNRDFSVLLVATSPCVAIAPFLVIGMWGQR